MQYFYWLYTLLRGGKMKWLIGLSLVFVAVFGGLIVAGIIAFTIALDEWSKNEK